MWIIGYPHHLNDPVEIVRRIELDADCPSRGVFQADRDVGLEVLSDPLFDAAQLGRAAVRFGWPPSFWLDARLLIRSVFSHSLLDFSSTPPFLNGQGRESNDMGFIWKTKKRACLSR
jgi:hypothetical protein